MEIGSFIELDFQKGKEYYSVEKNIARLNSGRAAIYHAIRLWGCNTVYLPIYQCESVREFLYKKNIKIIFYSIDSDFCPKIDAQAENSCVVIVNYFGIMSNSRMTELSERYKRVIVDNSQAFFSTPVDEAYSVYSARKFVGVPDGAYVIGKNAEKYTQEYLQGFSSDTSLFLLQRCEYGCEGKTYESRTKNEERIDSEDIMKMSALTRTILDGCNYGFCIEKRKENFEIADKLFGEINRLEVKKYYDKNTVPMVYPLLVEDETLLERMLQAKHFQGHWWKYITKETKEDDFEHWLSKYMIPITIDQRYGRKELEYIRGLI